MADTTTTDAGGYSRIQHSIGTAADWEKYNPAIRPGELAIVVNPDGKVSIKVNMSMADKKYEELPTVWDESTAEKLRSNLADTQTAASGANDAKLAAQKYAQQAEASANSINDKTILAITDSVSLAINATDGGLDLVVTTE
ncbi:hypothetical protein [Megasphaera sp.]|uniref:hypothetical protein n=1 Tax=Megasphaera sp. TaxID=2023260 RepID=UPI003FF0ED3F